jgi:hypothetical protein
MFYGATEDPVPTESAWGDPYYNKMLDTCGGHSGPQLIPQPGSLFRRDAYEQTGGLDFRYKWAFDLDLFIRLSRVGKFKNTPRVLAKFRWHDGSLSVGGREGSVNEASVIRIAALPGWIRPIAALWEAPIRRIILMAGKRLTIRSKSS